MKNVVVESDVKWEIGGGVGGDERIEEGFGIGEVRGMEGDCWDLGGGKGFGRRVFFGGKFLGEMTMRSNLSLDRRLFRVFDECGCWEFSSSHRWWYLPHFPSIPPPAVFRYSLVPVSVFAGFKRERAVCVDLQNDYYHMRVRP